MVIKTGIMGEYNDEPDLWYERFKKLHNQTTAMDIFECDGHFYYGNEIEAVKDYMDSEPDNDMKLSEWLQDHWTRFEPLRKD